MRAVFTILVLFWASCANAETLHVRPVGAEYTTEDGLTYESAFDGFADVTWGVGVGKVSAGDTLCVDNAESFTEERLTIGLTGSAGNIITIDGDCASTGNKAHLDNTASFTIQSQDKEYIAIKNIHFSNTGEYASVLFYNSKHNLFTLNEFSGTSASQDVMLQINASAVPVDLEDTTISYNYFHDSVTSTAIHISRLGANVSDLMVLGNSVARVNKFFRAYGTTTATCDAAKTIANLHVLHNTVTDTVAGFVEIGQGVDGSNGLSEIAYNRILNAGDGSVATNAIVLGGAVSVKVHDNYINGGDSVTSDGHGIALDRACDDAIAGPTYSSNSLVYANTILNRNDEENSTGIQVYRGNDNLIYNNLLVGNSIGLSVGGAVLNTANLFYNNTIVGSTKAGYGAMNVSSVGAPTSNVLKNNLFVDGMYGIYTFVGNSVPVHENNLYYNNSSADRYDDGTNLSFDAGTGELSSDPLLTPDYKLKQNSPARKAGATGIGVTRDFLNRPIDATPDIGAYQSREMLGQFGSSYAP